MPGWARAQMGLPAWGGQVWGPGGYPAYGGYRVPYTAYGPAAPEQELAILQDQADYLEQMLSDINQRIGEREARAEDSPES
jgi:hypothetical protein